MSKNRTVTRTRFTIRLFGRGVFVGLLGLALTISILSFLTACICDDMLNAAFVRKDEIKPEPLNNKIGLGPQSSGDPVNTPSTDQ